MTQVTVSGEHIFLVKMAELPDSSSTSAAGRPSVELDLAEVNQLKIPIGRTFDAPVVNIKISLNEIPISPSLYSISSRIEIQKKSASSPNVLLVEPWGEN